MKILLDTHLLLWAAGEPEKLSDKARQWISDPRHEPLFSAASIWEVAIKTSLGRPDFQVSAVNLRRGLFANGYDEIAISGRHGAAIANLPDLHKDPFDRILIAQAQVEELTLLTNDEVVSRYPGPVVSV